jgi:hypothetical protein
MRSKLQPNNRAICVSYHKFLVINNFRYAQLRRHLKKAKRRAEIF